MQLLYIWIEKYNDLNEIEFNFNPMYEFKYDKKENTLRVIVNNDKEKDNSVIFNEIEDDKEKIIENITAIVGSNGVGKTSLLHCICEQLAYDNENIKKSFGRRLGKFIFILKDNKNKLKFFVESSTICESANKKLMFKAEFKIINNECKENIFTETKDLKQEVEKLDIMFISNAVTSNNNGYENCQSVHDLSTIGMIKNSEIENELNFEIEQFFYYEIKNQVEFVTFLGLKKCTKLFGVIKNFLKIPKDIKLKFYNELMLKNRFKQKLDVDKTNSKDKKELYKKMNELIDGIDKIIEERNFNTGKYTGKRMLLYSCMLYYKDVLKYRKRLKKEEIEVLNKLFDNIERVLSQKVIKKLDKIIENFEFARQMLKFLNNEDGSKIFDINENVKHDFVYENYDNECVIERPVNKNMLPLLMAYISSVKGDNHYINFSWGMSSGEYNMFNLFSRIYHDLNLYRTRYLKKDTLLILIDEADLYFHPSWQQNYLQLIIKFLKEITNIMNIKTKIQIIFNTHSPIMLSDMPFDNTIYLEKIDYVIENANVIKNVEVIKNVTKEKKRNLFGANIYDLYKDSFFMDYNKIGLITGKLSEDHIEKVKGFLEEIDEKIEEIEKDKDKISKLQDLGETSKEKLKYCKAVIRIIGEPILRKALNNKYIEIEEKLNNKHNLYYYEFVKFIEENMYKISSEEKENIIRQLKENK